MSKKVAISLPEDLFSKMERARKQDGLDRSSWIQRSVLESLRRRRHDADVAVYVRSYTEEPEGPEELEWADAALRSLSRALRE